MGRRHKELAITMPDQEFCQVWNEADKVRDVALLLGASSSYCRWRATVLRQRGWHLKKFPNGFQGMTAEERTRIGKLRYLNRAVVRLVCSP